MSSRAPPYLLCGPVSRWIGASRRRRGSLGLTSCGCGDTAARRVRGKGRPSASEAGAPGWRYPSHAGPARRGPATDDRDHHAESAAESVTGRARPVRWSSSRANAASHGPAEREPEGSRRRDQRGHAEPHRGEDVARDAPRARSTARLRRRRRRRRRRRERRTPPRGAAWRTRAGSAGRGRRPGSVQLDRALAGRPPCCSPR